MLKQVIETSFKKNGWKELSTSFRFPIARSGKEVSVTVWFPEGKLSICVYSGSLQFFHPVRATVCQIL